MTRYLIGDINNTVKKGKPSSIEGILRELVKAQGLRKVAKGLRIDHASLYRSLKDGSNIKLERVKKLLDYLGYEIRVVKSAKHTKPKRRSYDSKNQKSN